MMMLKTILRNQFDAALSMMSDCLVKCPEAHWDGIIGKYPFWMVAYHTLCFVDLYFSPDETTYQPRADLHPAGWDEFNEEYPSRRFERSELLHYVQICRTKGAEQVERETATSFEGPSGHARRTFSRAELYLMNLRHLMHHTGQLSAFLRRVGQEPMWVSSGWKQA